MKLRLESLCIASGSSAVGMNAISGQPHPETHELVYGFQLEDKNRSSRISAAI